MSQELELEETKTESNSKQTCYIDVEAVKQHNELGLPYKPSLFDLELTRFFQSIKDKDTIGTTITHMTRVNDYDIKSHKQNEFLFWYETISGIDNDGNTITVSNIPKGITQQLHGLQYEENILIPKEYSSKRVYTVEFTSKKAQELIDNSSMSDSIEFECLSGNKSYGGFTSDEFIQCSYQELCYRGASGLTAMYPGDFELLKINPAERFAIQTQRVIKK